MFKIDEIINGVIIFIIGSAFILLFSKLIRSNKLKKGIKKIFIFLKSLTKEHLIGFLSFLFGILFIVIAIIMAEGPDVLNYGNTKILGITETCDNNYKCYWEINNNQVAYLPLKIKTDRMISLDLEYQTDGDAKLFFNLGKGENEVSLKPYDGRINLIDNENINDYLILDNSTWARMNNFLDLFNMRIVYLKLSTDSKIRIMKISFEHKAIKKTGNLTIGIIGLVYLVYGLILITRTKTKKKRRKQKSRK